MALADAHLWRPQGTEAVHVARADGAQDRPQGAPMRQFALVAKRTLGLAHLSAPLRRTPFKSGEHLPLEICRREKFQLWV